MDGIHTLDVELFRAIHLGWSSRWLDPVFLVFSYLGLTQVQILGVLLFYPLPLLRLLWRRSLRRLGFRNVPLGSDLNEPVSPAVLNRFVQLQWKVRPYLSSLIVTILGSGILGQIIKKLLIERERPSNLGFAIPQEAWKHNSFPSGHTITSFALAFMLVYLTVGTKRAWVGYAALVVAGVIGLSRIYRGVHWPSDVLASMFLGGAFAAALYLLLDRLGHWIKQDNPQATFTGREASEAAS